MEHGGEVEARCYQAADVGDQRDARGHGGVARRYRGRSRSEVRGGRGRGGGEGGVDDGAGGEDGVRLGLEGELDVDEGRDGLDGAIVLAMV